MARLDHFGLNYQQKALAGVTRWSGLYRPIPRSEVVNRSGISMVQEEDVNAKLMAHLRFTSGQVNMLMDLCLAFIAANTNSAELAQRFEATVNTTLAHTDTKLACQEFLDGELDIVNRVRSYVIGALPRNEQLFKEFPVLLTAPADVKELASTKSSATRSLEALTIEWTEKASTLEQNKLSTFSTTSPEVD